MKQVDKQKALKHLQDLLLQVEKEKNVQAAYETRARMVRDRREYEQEQALFAALNDIYPDD